MFDILSIIPGKKKNSSSGWISFNAICCTHYGHRSDRRMRGGIKFDENNWSMHCFNCGFKCNFVLGRTISEKTRKLLTWCGIDQSQIQRWSLESLQHKDLLDFTKLKKPKVKIKFEERLILENDLVESLRFQKEIRQAFVKIQTREQVISIHENAKLLDRVEQIKGSGISKNIESNPYFTSNDTENRTQYVKYILRKIIITIFIFFFLIII